jgi:hypothetical protein
MLTLRWSTPIEINRNHRRGACNLISLAWCPFNVMSRKPSTEPGGKITIDYNSYQENKYLLQGKKCPRTAWLGTWSEKQPAINTRQEENWVQITIYVEYKSLQHNKVYYGSFTKAKRWSNTTCNEGEKSMNKQTSSSLSLRPIICVHFLILVRLNFVAMSCHQAIPKQGQNKNLKTLVLSNSR